MLSIIAWIIVGGIAGWIAGMIMKTRMGLVADIIVGIVGAFIGGFVLNALNIGTSANANDLNIGSIVTAVIGAIILLGILRLFNRGSVTA